MEADAADIEKASANLPGQLLVSMMDGAMTPGAQAAQIVKFRQLLISVEIYRNRKRPHSRQSAALRPQPRYKMKGTDSHIFLSVSRLPAP